MSYDPTKRKPEIRRRGHLRECAGRSCSTWLSPEEVKGEFCRTCSSARRATSNPTPGATP